MICVKLKYTNPWNETFWFVSLGDPWPNRPGIFMVKRTTTKKERGKCFESAEAAAAMLLMINNPAEWSIVVEDPDENKEPIHL